jgi:ureidoglycolate hydrolase
MKEQPELNIYQWNQPGYKPLVFSHDWQVAILNWEPAALTAAITEVERHTCTDEVFVLTQGTAALVTTSKEGVEITEAIPGVIYNVKMGCWHTVIGARDSSWIIVENRDTHTNDTEMRLLTSEELIIFREQLPEWAQ